MGIEPTSSAWEADILPMNYARNNVKFNQQLQPKRILTHRKCFCKPRKNFFYFSADIKLLITCFIFVKMFVT